MIGTADLGLDPRFNRLMGGWRDIVEDTRQLGKRIAELPETCHCVAGGGICECCAPLERAFPEMCRICADEVRSLVPRIEQVLDDALRYLPSVRETAPTTDAQLKQSFRDVTMTALRLVRTIDSLRAASGEFRQGCRTGHVVALKRVVSRLTEAVETAHARLRSL